MEGNICTSLFLTCRVHSRRLLLVKTLETYIMADAGRDISEQIGEDGDPLTAGSKSSAHRGSFAHRDSFNTVNKDFSVYNEDVPNLSAADPLLPGRRRTLLLACACILGNELCERLAYYGLQTNMGEDLLHHSPARYPSRGTSHTAPFGYSTSNIGRAILTHPAPAEPCACALQIVGLYLKKVLGYPADTASQLLQVWKATVYLTPLVGAYLADAVMGRCVSCTLNLLCFRNPHGWLVSFICEHVRLLSLSLPFVVPCPVLCNGPRQVLGYPCVQHHLLCGYAGHHSGERHSCNRPKQDGTAPCGH